MASGSTPLPPPPVREPVTGRDGLITPVWMTWFTQFYARVGGAISPTPVDNSVMEAFDTPLTVRPQQDDSAAFDAPPRRILQDEEAAFDSPQRRVEQNEELAWFGLQRPIPALASGTYTPTLTQVANLDASTAYECQYLRIGNVVTVSGKVEVDSTAAATTQLGISLPFPSNIGAAEDCAGTAFASAIAGQGAAILGDATNNRAQMEWIAVDTTNQPMYFTFTYQIILP